PHGAEFFAVVGERGGCAREQYHDERKREVASVHDASSFGRTMAGGGSRAKTKKWTSLRPVAPTARSVRSAFARGRLHVSKMAQQQPRGKRPNQLTWALEAHAARAYRLRERHRTGPHARDRPGVGADDEVDVEAWIFEADVGAFTREDEPARLKA